MAKPGRPYEAETNQCLVQRRRAALLEPGARSPPPRRARRKELAFVFFRDNRPIPAAGPAVVFSGGTAGTCRPTMERPSSPLLMCCTTEQMARRGRGRRWRSHPVPGDCIPPAIPTLWRAPGREGRPRSRYAGITSPQPYHPVILSAAKDLVQTTRLLSKIPALPRQNFRPPRILRCTQDDRGV